MIEKLESAGLGFYVKATETQQKLGELGMGKQTPRRFWLMFLF